MKPWVGLMQTMMEYRHRHAITHQLQKIRERYSMLHVDVLTLIYHFAKTYPGDVLEIGACLGGSTMAAAQGVRDSGERKSIISIEQGGQSKHPRLRSKNILRDLKKNLTKCRVADLVTVVEGRSEDPTVSSAVRRHIQPGGVGLLIIDADGRVKRDIDLYHDLLAEDCWVVIDDYYMPGNESKAVLTRPQVDAFVLAGHLEIFGLYGWGTWIGRWHAALDGDEAA